jgi:glycerol-3-phosphate acyltransferase PlsY
MGVGLLALCYLIGSIPIAWIVVKLVTGKDIRTIGSGNVGVMNTALNVTRWAALLVLAGEAAKGALAVLLAHQAGVSELYLGLAVVAAVAGTRWSIWVSGAGGRGNTTGVSALLLLAWQSVALSLVIWIAVRILTHRSFWATRVWILSLPVALLLATQSWVLAGCGMLLSLIYLSAHDTGTDDHTRIRENWPSLWAFLREPPRRTRL